MIKLFRKYRQNLIYRDKAWKYLLYAIGEIILVTIGILIALNINNSNENRKKHILEKKILLGIESDFKETKRRLQETIKLQSNVVDHAVALINIIEHKDRSISNDSIRNSLSMGALSYHRAEPVVSTYDALIGAGNTSIITDENLLTSLADFSSVFKSGFEDEHLAIEIYKMLEESIKEDLHTLLNDYGRGYLGLNYRPTEGEQITAVKKLFRNKAFLSHLIERTFVEKNRLDRQKKLLALCENVLIPFRIYADKHE